VSFAKKCMKKLAYNNRHQKRALWGEVSSTRNKLLAFVVGVIGLGYELQDRRKY